MADGSLPPAPGVLRPDLQLIADLIAPDSRVLDVGCGDGALLAWLTAQKNVDGRGIEISRDGVRACVSHGLSVIQGDANTDLKDYPSDAFDYVVLSKTLQATRNPREVLQDLVRIGRRAAVSFVNYGHWRIRLGLLVTGRMPVTDGNGRRWFDSEDIHPCTLMDFVELCRDLGLAIENAMLVGRDGTGRAIDRVGGVANLTGEQALFILRRG
jgi:methionine biosynthesis protein MetW